MGLLKKKSKLDSTGPLRRLHKPAKHINLDNARLTRTLLNHSYVINFPIENKVARVNLNDADNSKGDNSPVLFIQTVIFI